MLSATIYYVILVCIHIFTSLYVYIYIYMWSIDPSSDPISRGHIQPQAGACGGSCCIEARARQGQGVYACVCI